MIDLLLKEWALGSMEWENVLMDASPMDDRSMPARPTLKDVGRLAGVSAQTVSRYLTGKAYVADATARRIQLSVDALGYRPNWVARGLQEGRTNTIGVLTAGALNYGAAQTLTGLNAQAHATDTTVISAHVEVSTAPAHRELKAAIDRLISMRVDGILLAARIDGLESVLHDAVRDQAPIVTIGGRRLAPFDNLSVDSYRAGRLAVEHLIGLGHRRIAFLSGPRNSAESQERERAYHDAMAQAGATILPVFPGGDWTSDAGYRVGMTADWKSFSALFAGNDELALGFLAAARANGVHAPSNVSIVGIDDMPEAKYFVPPLTTARLDFVTLGRKALEMLQKRINSGAPQEHLTIAPQLIVRESTRPFPLDSP